MSISCASQASKEVADLNDTDYLVSGVQTGCTLVMFDGSPLFRPELLWKMVDDLGVTVFGTVRRPLHSVADTGFPFQAGAD